MLPTFTLMFVVLSPVYVSLSWAIYLGSKWIAGLLGVSVIDQTVMGVMAVVLVFAVFWAAMASLESEH